MGQGFVSPQGARMGLESFSCHVVRDGDVVRQNYAKRGGRLHPSASPYLIAIPLNNKNKHILYNIIWVFGFTFARLCFHFSAFSFFFIFFFSRSCWLFFHEQCISVGPVHYLRDLQISFFSNFFIKNGFYRTVHTFKYYFAIIFSIFSKISYIQIDLILSKRVKIDKAKQSDCKVQSYK